MQVQACNGFGLGRNCLTTYRSKQNLTCIIARALTSHSHRRFLGIHQRYQRSAGLTVSYLCNHYEEIDYSVFDVPTSTGTEKSDLLTALGVKLEAIQKASHC